MSRSTTRRLQRISGILLAILVVSLLADSAFLLTAATPEGLVGPMQQLHVVLGAALCVVLPLFVASHFLLHQRHRNAGARRIGLIVAAVAIVGCVAGLGLWAVGKSSAVRWIVLTHELAFVVALATYLVHRLRALVTPALRGELVAVVLAVAGAGGIWVSQAWWPSDGNPDAARPELRPGLSQIRAASGHTLAQEDLANPKYCAQCHPAIADQWEASAHHFSSLNDPFYAATLAVSQTHRNPDELKFCGGCHDPVLLLSGAMDQHPKPEDPGADAGITCVACHAITEAPGRIGNGSYVLAKPEHYPGYAAEDPDERAQSNRLIRSKPEQHIASFGPSYLRSPQFCAPCHKAHIPAALNRHRWLRGQNEFDAWHDSGAGAFSARTFFPPKEQKRCQDCHMPRTVADDPAADEDGTVADHGFVGANTALARHVGDEQWVERSRRFLKGVLTVDVGAVEAEDGQRVLAPSSPVSMPAGKTVTVDIVVRNVGSGHFYPAGIADLREAWLEIEFADAVGVRFASGWLDAKGNLDPDAHVWQAVLLDAEGVPLDVHDVERAQVVLTSRRIMLGASDVVRFSFVLPDGGGLLSARVLDRKLPRAYVEFALGADAPAMPVVEVASATFRFTTGEVAPLQRRKGDGARLRNLGIAHLLRGDTATARAAAQAAAERMPDDAGPRLDLARAALADGDLALAEEHVRAADGITPGHPTAAWLLGRIRAARGDHVSAIEAFDAALKTFPRDREVLLLKAASLYRLERDDKAEVELKTVLEIDPEHLSAHALLTKIYTDRGDEAATARHREAWDRVRPRSEDKVLAERARQANPSLDRRANEQYVLPLKHPTASWRRAN